MNCLLSDEEDKWMESIINMKNSVIGNNKHKNLAVQQGIIPRLLQWMIDDGINVELRTEAAIVLGSLAKGSEEDIQMLINAGSVSVLLMRITSNNMKLVEACLRCLRTIFLMNDPPIHLMYENKTVIPHLINIISKSLCTQDCITTLFSRCCTR